MIETTALSRWFGTSRAVDRLDLHIPAGAVVGFLGPNGAGKSTTLRMLSGFLPPSGGSGTIAGFDIVRQSPKVRRRIGYLPESTPLYPDMRVAEYLRFRARLYALPRRGRKAAIDRVIHRCWLRDVRGKAVGHLSKGYRQRLGLAAALLHAPPVLLLDEPTAGLDPTQIREVRGLIRELAGNHTVLLSTHILPEVEMTCDRVVIIARGRIRAQGTLDEIRATATGPTNYILETDAPDVVDALRAMSGVDQVTAQRQDGGWRRLSIHAAPGTRDLRESIAQYVSSRGGRIRELARQSSTLEQLFIRLTSDVGGADDAPAAGASTSAPAMEAGAAP